MSTKTEVSGEYGLKFSKPRIVMTVRGEREVRNAEPTEEFWTAWRAGKDVMKAAGWSVNKGENGWQVSTWRETMARADRIQAHEMSRAQDANITIPVPEGCELMPFQRAGVAYALAREGTLIGDEMGLGKTVQAICLANKIEAKRILVVAPASLLFNWRNEIGRWQIGGMPVYVIRPGCKWPDVTEGWFVINYDIVARYEAQLRAQAWDLAIMDECQYMKTRTAKRTKLLLGGGRGDDKVEPIPAKRKVLMTGTPIMNRPAELFPILHYLDPKRWPTFSGYAKRYCGGGYNGYGYDASGATNLDELQARLRETVMVRRLKADVLTELPAKRRQVVTIASDDDGVIALIKRESEINDRMENDIAQANYEAQKAEAAGDNDAYKRAIANLKKVQGIAFTEMSKIRHEVALAKLPYVIEHLANVAGKCLVFAHHLDVVEGLVDALADRGVVSITGKTKNEDRQPIVEKFQTDPSIQFFVGNIKAAGVGLTLTASSHVVFGEIDWTPSNITQAEDRAHRYGQRESVLVQHIVLDGSLDAKMAKMLIAKQAVIDRALDNKIEIGMIEAEPIGLVPMDGEQPAKPIMPTPQKSEPIILSEAQVSAIHAALRVVAGFDADRASALNGIGFNKMDTRFGCELAERSSLSPRQAQAAMKLVRKYRRQYPANIYQQIFGVAA